MFKRFALTTILASTALSIAANPAAAEIVVTGHAPEFDWFFYERLLNAYDGGGGGGDYFGFDGSGGGGGGFDLDLPPDCTVELCVDEMEPPDESTVIVVEAKLTDSVNSMTDAQLREVQAYAYIAAYELDYQIKLRMLGWEPDFSYYESLMTTAFEQTVRYGVQNGAITLRGLPTP